MLPVSSTSKGGPVWTYMPKLNDYKCVAKRPVNSVRKNFNRKFPILSEDNKTGV